MAKEKAVNAPPAKTDGAQQTGAIQPLNFSTLADGAPAWLKDKMKGQAPKGLEAADKDDFIYPRLVLCQGLTPDVADGKRQQGDIIDNITRELLVPQHTPLPFIPVILSKSRMYMTPIDEGGGILCRSFDSLEAQPGGCGKDQGEEPTTNCSECIYAQWDALSEGDKEDDNGAPKCTLFYNILGFLPTMGGRVTVWSGKATNVKVIRRFLSICKQTGADLWAHKFELGVKDEQSGKFKFKNWSFESKGFVTLEEYARGESIYNELSGKNWVEKTKLDDQQQPKEKDAPF